MPSNKLDNSTQSEGRKHVKKAHRRSSFQGHRRNKKTDIYKKLYREAGVRQKKREKMQERIREIEAPQNYMPKINDYPVAQHDDISDRLYEEHKKRREKDMKKLSDVRNIDKECTFHPTINSKSEKLVVGKDTQSRLLRPKMNFAAPPTQKFNDDNDEDMTECTFHPHINQISASQNQRGPVFDRLYAVNKKKTSKLSKKEPKESECTFKPTISDYKMSSRGDVYERLSQPKPSPVPHVAQNQSEGKVVNVERINQLYSMGLKRQKTRNLESQGMSTPGAVDDDNTLSQYNFQPKLETSKTNSFSRVRSRVDCFNHGYVGHNYHTLGRNGVNSNGAKVENESDDSDDSVHEEVQNNGDYQQNYDNQTPIYGNGY